MIQDRINHLMKKQDEFGFLKRIIETNLGICVETNRSREREVVNAKMIYAYILQGKGYGCSAISKSIRMNHATVLHYFKTVPFYLKGDIHLRKSYERIKSEYASEYDPVYYLSENELKKELITLRNEKELLSLELEQLKSQVHAEKLEAKKMDSRFSFLYKMVSERTRLGSEDEVLRRLNQFYNGVYDKGHR
tara:strand:+ start:484 stop:1059 length:576 start_codon:yes stop_codon:yes gene_type:complete